MKRDGWEEGRKKRGGTSLSGISSELSCQPIHYSSHATYNCTTRHATHGSSLTLLISLFNTGDSASITGRPIGPISWEKTGGLRRVTIYATSSPCFLRNSHIGILLWHSFFTLHSFHMNDFTIIAREITSLSKYIRFQLNSCMNSNHLCQ